MVESGILKFGHFSNRVKRKFVHGAWFSVGSTERLKLNNEKGPQWEPHLTALVREGRGWPKAVLVQAEGCGVSPAPCLLRVEAVRCPMKLCYLFKKFSLNRKKPRNQGLYNT